MFVFVCKVVNDFLCSFPFFCFCLMAFSSGGGGGGGGRVGPVNLCFTTTGFTEKGISPVFLTCVQIPVSTALHE